MKKILKLSAFLLIVGLSACKKKGESPCEKYKNLKATFIIQPEHLFDFNKSMGTKYTTDTLFLSFDNYFESINNFDEYKWLIEGDPSFVRTTKSFKMWFNKPMKFNLLLIGKRNPNTCNGNITHFDTTIHQIVVQEDAYTPLFIGNYIGYLKSNPIDTMHLFIRFRDSFENDGVGLHTKYTFSMFGLYNKWNKEDKIRVIGGGYKSAKTFSFPDVIDEKGVRYQIKDALFVREKNKLFVKYKVFETRGPKKAQGYLDELLIAEKIN